MEINYKPYNRIQIYLTKLSSCSNDENSGDWGLTLNELAEQTEIPISIIRNDFCILLSFGNYLGFDINDDSDEYLSIDEKFGLANLLDTNFGSYQTKIKELLLEGKLDHVKFIYRDGDPDVYTLPLQLEEYEAYRNFNNQKSIEGLQSLFLIKDSFRFKSTLEIFNNLVNIIDAMKLGKSLRIKYIPRNGSGKMRDLKIKPLKIIYDSVDNEYAVLSIYRHAAEVFRLNNITYVQSIKEDIKVPEKDLKLIDNIDQVWGMNFTGKPIKVKVRFEDFGNVWNKVRKYLAFRTKGRLEEKNGFLYYEDTVYGIDAFRSWIYSFGSAAIVEEPQSLRDQIIKSLEERLKDY